jgi:mannose-6-phosphate isomerase class I
MLLRGERFELRLFKVHGKGVKVFTEGKLQVLTCVRGEVKLKSKSDAELSLTPVETVLVPACVERFEMSGEGEIVCANYSHPSNKLQLINHEINTRPEI